MIYSAWLVYNDAYILMDLEENLKYNVGAVEENVISSIIVLMAIPIYLVVYLIFISSYEIGDRDYEGNPINKKHPNIHKGKIETEAKKSDVDQSDWKDHPAFIKSNK